MTRGHIKTILSRSPFQIAALEGQVFLQTGRLANLSVQEMVDCSFENSGCGGGLPGLAFEYVEREGGISDEKDYRAYNATVRLVCSREVLENRLY